MEEIRYCHIPYCLNVAAKKRKMCNKCRTRKYRENNPLMSTYHINKSNAKRRDVPFEITVSEFKQFCVENDYLLLKGTKPDSLTIDRIRADLGYTYANMQVLPLIDNVRKQHVERKARKSWSNTSCKRMSDDIF